MPFLLNVTGSVWFFLLIGQAGEFVISSRDGTSGRGRGKLGSDKTERPNKEIRRILMLWPCRTQSYSPYHEFFGFLVYSAGRMVG